MKLAPILLFTYNRPWHTAQVIKSLKKNELSEFSDIVIFSDGPKNEDDKKNVQAVRDYLRTIDGFKSITINETEKNKGLSASVIQGVTESLAKHEKVIVLEDDLETAPGFLCYMNQALVKYKNTEEVMQISGYMFDVNHNAETDAIFLPFTTSWGWATWQRAWDHFDPNMSGYNKLKFDRTLRHKFDLEGTYKYFHLLDAQINGLVDSWAIRWYLSVFMKGGIVLYPTTSLVSNIGHDNSGTHRSAPFLGRHTNLHLCTRWDNRCFPETVVSTEAYEKVKKILASHRSLRKKIISLLSIIVNRLMQACTS